ncbi:MAG: M28 family peptidase [Candidatus Latescibacteria bacterium]|jgi:Zn-dependent M28 family amino/carboxypeptidase|nr:M28 family peptidase [Candidatus Latescibacterota bacterium]
MTRASIADLISRVDSDRLSAMLFHLCSDPLPFRKLNYTRPGASKNSLYEADDHIQECLESSGYPVEKEAVRVQAFRCDSSKPKAHQYSPAQADDPWYTAHNIYANRSGDDRRDEIILFLAHKDSQSWVDCPGAYDNGVGTVALLEIARVLGDYEPRCTLRFLFCNEEHTPWTSVRAAEKAVARGDDYAAIYNVDSLGGKSQEDIDAGWKTNVTMFTEPEGERFADLMAEVNETYGIGLDQTKGRRPNPGDDDGSFIKAGFPNAVINVGSFPYADPAYHTEEDGPDRVDIGNLTMAAQASLAALLHVDLGLMEET